MSRTITALFDTREDAEDGQARLKAANCDISHVRIHDQQSVGHHEGYSTAEDRGLWSTNNAFLPDDDRYAYEEGVRRGGYLLTVDVDEDDVDGAIKALENTRCVDLDERSSAWRSEGWAPPATKGAFFGGGQDSETSDRDYGRETDEERIPIVEEQLVVGKREVGRGGVKVRSYVAETPVHEQVRLREEHVDIERRPVDRAVGASDADAFRDRSIEMTETREEAVIGKEARVVEEVVVRKTADEHVEDIEDTVRRTEVDVEDLGRSDTSGFDRDRRSDKPDRY